MNVDELLRSRHVGDADAFLQHVGPGADLIVPIANGEPVTLLNALERRAAQNPGSLHDVTVHQMHALRDRPMMHLEFGDHLVHRSYFLSHVTRPCFLAGTVDLVPNHFSEVYDVLRRRAAKPFVVAAVSPPDKHGNFSLGVSADYAASFIGRAPFFLEVNRQMPRTTGRNQIHVSQVLGWVDADYPLIELAPATPSNVDARIGAFVAERIPNGSTIQAGIGAIPNAVLGLLDTHVDLGVHTELISDGLINLIERGVITGVKKANNRLKVIGTFILGTQRLYDFVHDNPTIEMWSARYYSSSGGQSDFARGAAYSEGGQSFIVMQSTAKDGEVSRIVPQLAAGDVVTTQKNTVDKVVTEYGVAELRGRSIRERTRALINIAHPRFRDDLEHSARQLNYL